MCGQKAVCPLLCFRFRSGFRSGCRAFLRGGAFRFHCALRGGFAFGEHRFDFRENPLLKLVILLKERLHRFPSLSELFAFKREPGAAFFKDSHIGADIDDGADPGDPLVPVDIEFGGLERGCKLVLDNLDTGARACF